PISPYYFLLMIPPPPISTLFPYTTLFRSNRMKEKAHIEEDRFFVCASSCCPYNILELCCLDNITRGECEIRAEIFSSRTFDGLRSEEHTSELQSRFDLVCRLLLEKKKQII